MADNLFPKAVNGALSGNLSDEETSAGDTGGALSRVSTPAPASMTPSMFGNNPYQDKLFDLLAKPPIDESSKWLAFSGAMMGPTKTGSFGESMGAGLTALSKGQQIEEQYKQQYRQAMIEQFALLARQQNAFNQIPGMGTVIPNQGSLPAGTGMPPGVPAAGTPASAIPPSTQTTGAIEANTPVPGYHGITYGDARMMLVADPTGKSLAEAKEKRATSSMRAGDLLFNMDPNGAGWVVNGTSLTAATLMKTISAQIESNNAVVEVPQSDGTTKTMSRAQALHMQNQLSSLPGMPGANPVSTPKVAAGKGTGEGPKVIAPQAAPIVPAAPEAGGPAPTAPTAPVTGVSQTPGAKKAVEEHAAYAGSVPKQIHEEAETALQSNYALSELQQLATGFTPGKAAPLRQALAEYASSMNLTLDPKALEAASDMEAFNKIGLGLATQASKQLSARPSQLEFQKMVEANPNIALLPAGLQKILVYTQFKNNLALKKEQAFNSWSQNVSPDKYDQFLPYWHNVQSQNLANPAFRTSMDRPAGPAATAANPLNNQPAVQDTRVLGGKTYVRINGVWHVRQ